jgi:hypothetical protein
LITILVDAFLFLRANLFAITILTIWIEFPFILIIKMDLLDNISDPMNSWIQLIKIVFILIVTPFSIGAQSEFDSQIINGASLNLRKCLQRSKESFFSMFFASFSFLILLIGGLVLFVLPGIIIGSRLSFFPFFIVFEKHDPISAFKKSYSVTKDIVLEIALPLIFFNAMIIIPWFVILSSFQNPGISNYAVAVLTEFVFAILGWINLIVPFRAYAIYRNNRVES